MHKLTTEMINFFPRVYLLFKDQPEPITRSLTGFILLPSGSSSRLLGPPTF